MSIELTIAIVLAVLGIAITSVTFLAYTNHDISGLFGSVFGIGIGLVITILFYRIQKKDQENQHKLIERIDRYNEEQKELHRSIKRGPLSIITNKFIFDELSGLESIKDDNKMNEKLVDNTGKYNEAVNTISEECRRIINYIPADIYFDITSVTKNFLDLICEPLSCLMYDLEHKSEDYRLILSKINRLLNQFDYLIYPPLKEKEYSTISFENIHECIRCIIV